MKMKFLPCLFLATLLFSGCVTPQNIAPAVERVQTTASSSQVKSAIIEEYTSDGWHLERETDHMISFVKEVNNPMAQLLYSSNYDSKVMSRETVTIIESQDGVTLSASQDLVTNYGSSFERTTAVGTDKSDVRLIFITSSLKNKAVMIPMLPN
jgi:hypothetical protein